MEVSGAGRKDKKIHGLAITEIDGLIAQGRRCWDVARAPIEAIPEEIIRYAIRGGSVGRVAKKFSVGPWSSAPCCRTRRLWDAGGFGGPVQCNRWGREGHHVIDLPER